jgi:hypothetical protein
MMAREMKGLGAVLLNPTVMWDSPTEFASQVGIPAAVADCRNRGAAGGSGRRRCGTYFLYLAAGARRDRATAGLALGVTSC